MNPKYQIFISSTKDDMQDERLAVTMLILSLQHIPSSMEFFVTAAHEKLINTIEKKIEECDIFILLLGGRYGWMIPDMETSYVDYEYEYAKKKEKPIIAVIIDENYLKKKRIKAIKKGKEYYDNDNQKCYNTLLSKVRNQGKAALTYSSILELENHISKAIAFYEKNSKEYSLIGLVSADEFHGCENLLAVRRDVNKETLKDRLSKFKHIRVLAESSYNLLNINSELYQDVSHLCNWGIKFDFISINPSGEAVDIFIESLETEDRHDEDVKNEFKNALNYLKKLISKYPHAVQGRVYDYFFPYAMMIHYTESLGIKKETDYIKLDLYSVRTSDHERRVIHFRRKDFPEHFEFFENEYDTIFSISTKVQEND
ncbi:MAG: DUF4062 domain-containing protein [Lachnospiraceae bacterium]|nr:DUF4062 domain-containing protein [Lachnospiraceae bacterium]